MSRQGYHAIIISLAAHVMVLGGLHWFTKDGSLTESVFSDEEHIAVELMVVATPTEMEMISDFSDVRNLTANENAQRSNEARDFSSRSKQRAADDIYNDLKSLEQQVLDDLARERAEKAGSDSDVELSTAEKEDREDYEWFNDKSYDGKVSASYNLEGRDDLDLRKPTYRCKDSGTVIVDITVSQKGIVVDAKINSSSSTNTNCLLEESLKYAKMCRFNSSLSAPKKQEGTITYVFIPQ